MKECKIFILIILNIIVISGEAFAENALFYFLFKFNFIGQDA